MGLSPFGPCVSYEETEVFVNTAPDSYFALQRFFQTHEQQKRNAKRVFKSVVETNL